MPRVGVRQLLEEDLADSTNDHFNELWAQAIPAMPVEGGMVNGCISDLQGRFNLTACFTKHRRALNSELSLAMKVVMLRFGIIYCASMIYLYFLDGLKLSLIGWMMTNSTKVGPDGAEEEEYSGQIPPQMIADAAMVEPSRAGLCNWL